MGTARATKAADKSQVCRKFVTALHKLYGKSIPGIELPVIETMLFAACLEDSPWVSAEVALKKLLASFFDFNEIRVSSVNELEVVLAPLDKADWKGLRIRSILRSVFESTYSYDLEKLRRQTMEQAVKTLKKIPDITPFIRDFVLHEILGSHIVTLDNSMLTAAKWMGLVPKNADLHEASEYLKGGLKKSEVSEFCQLLRCLATDPKFIPRFADHAETEQGMEDVMDRFAELQLPPKKKPSKPPVAKEAPKPGKTETSKKSAATAPSPATGKSVSAKTAASARKSTSATKPAASASKKVPKPTKPPKAPASSKSGTRAPSRTKTAKPAAKKEVARSARKAASAGKQNTSKPAKKK